MIDLILSLLLGCLPPLVVGAIALLRSFGAPSGKVPAAVGGGLLVLAGLVLTGWEIYSRFVLMPDPSMAPFGVLPVDPAVLYAVRIGSGALVAAGVALLLVGVMSAGRLENKEQGPRSRHEAPGPYAPQARRP
ncbi:hypothetical protein [Nocardiopsis ganjiahuensis]|uniref:hypothetical protein n=1 Tax=Nocardiopsis ganjiahuensis TaxID=239984 RepID=UPI0003496A8C|nr:hypothetical protein [Nocardiopsis ganjiahuensis]